MPRFDVNMKMNFRKNPKKMKQEKEAVFLVIKSN